METTYTEGLVFFTDLAGFARLTGNLELSEIVKVLKDFAAITRKHVEKADGVLIKYIGDSALGYFPPERVDEGAAALIDMKQEIEESFEIKGQKTGLRIGANYGPFAVCDFTPFEEKADLVGETVNIAAMTGSGGRAKHRSIVIFTPEAFRKLSSSGRKAFHKYTEPIVYLA
ncbi:adenylate/guanylate cyclase domain-containing protein [Spirochaeta isovalerica]|uniref:Class 3 adenylate cyclase n=1 Tax=Spirochaeta isovalerica TaxID=150 RepID=A0A841RA80_9SPIO|nr:adenylate/guanylate cyclase domain-containing protein [Spirochaeta isovalerica]MBB6479352.1 class 3 adenylate cyclase [Spirochaeta isovalerica]